MPRRARGRSSHVHQRRRSGGRSTKPVENRANAAVTGAPGLLLASASAGQVDLCLGVQAAGYGSPMLGLTVSLSRSDRSCTRIRTAKALQGLGRPAAAVQVLCEDATVRRAMARAGTPCETIKEEP